MSPGSRLRVSFLFIFLIYSLTILLRYHPYTFLKGDSLIYGFTTTSLLKDGDLDLTNNLPFSVPRTQEKSFYAVDKEGNLVPKHSPFLPLLGLPWAALFGFNGLLMLNFLIGLGVVTLALFTMRNSRNNLSPVILAATFLQPVFLHYIYNFSPDLLATFLLVASFSAAVARREFLFGLLSAMMVLIRPIFAVQVLLGFLPSTRRWRYLAGTILPLLAWGTYNQIIFGAPWITGYQRVAVSTGTGIVIQSHAQLLNFDPLRMISILFSYPMGFLFTSALSLWQIFLLLQRRQYPRRLYLFLLLTVLWPFLFLWFYSPWAASSFGNRFLLPVSGVLIFSWSLRGWKEQTASGPGRPDDPQPEGGVGETPEMSSREVVHREE